MLVATRRCIGRPAPATRMWSRRCWLWRRPLMHLSSVVTRRLARWSAISKGGASALSSRLAPLRFCVPEVLLFW